MRQGKGLAMQMLIRGALSLVCLCVGVACEDTRVVPDAGPTADSRPADIGGAIVDVPGQGDIDPQLFPQFITGPELLPNPCALVPLAAIVTFTTDRPVTATLEIRAGQKTRQVTFTKTDTTFSLPVLGLEPEQGYTVAVLISAKGLQVRAPEELSGATGPLPPGFPPLETSISQTDKMEPGIILLNPFALTQGSRGGFTVAVNEAGKVVWFYHHEDYVKNTSKRLANGHLIFQGAKHIIESDMLGNTVQSWHTADVIEEPSAINTAVQASSFHHDLLELPSGNLLVLSREIGIYDNYPTSSTDPLAPTASTQVAGDLILELQRDGTIVKSWSLLQLLDPYRITYSSLNLKRWPTIWPEAKLMDWSHANGLAYDEGEDAILVSVRHQDALIKFSRQSGELVWILGPHDNWTAPWSQYLLTPQGDLEWPYHAHAPQITPQGTIMLFDNGNYRASPFDSPLPVTASYSRAVEFAVDAQSMTVSQLWSYAGPEDELFYSSSVSSAYQLPQTGNVLVADGNRATDQAGNPSAGEDTQSWARVVEVTGTTPAEKVFELVIKDEAALDPAKWKIYRSQKMPSLYPPQLAQVESIP